MLDSLVEVFYITPVIKNRITNRQIINKTSSVFSGYDWPVAFKTRVANPFMMMLITGLTAVKIGSIQATRHRLCTIFRIAIMSITSAATKVRWTMMIKRFCISPIFISPVLRG